MKNTEILGRVYALSRLFRTDFLAAPTTAFEAAGARRGLAPNLSSSLGKRLADARGVFYGLNLCSNTFGCKAQSSAD